MQRQLSTPQDATIPLLETESLTRALFVSRLNRFVVRFRRGTRFGRAYLANSGRLGEVLLPGTELWRFTRPLFVLILRPVSRLR